MELNLNRPIVFLDIESTGVKVASDRIIEICILKVMPGGEEIIKTFLLNPGMPIPPESTKIHGITDDDVNDKPTFQDVAHELNRMLANCDLAGYNSNKFDIPLLIEEFLRAGINFDIKNRYLVDVQNIFHKMEPRTLHAAYRFYCQKELVDAHTAEADTRATYEILKSQLDVYNGKQYTDQDGKKSTPVVNNVKSLFDFSYQSHFVDMVGHIVYNDKKNEVFNFGKYKGKPVEDVFRKEPQYYDWMMKAEFPLSTKNVITAIKLRGFNKGAINFQ
ncbi:MAG: 3'-5' exonuclease [Bacteroidetes bacterium]|nr:3'-5' exonuclease [Bacteroidota bacterium]